MVYIVCILFKSLSAVNLNNISVTKLTNGGTLCEKHVMQMWDPRV